MEKSPSRLDLPKLLFALFFILLLITTSFWVLSPFVLGFIWSGMVVIATWPLLEKLQQRLWGKRWIAVSIMTLLLVLLFVIPIALLVSSLVENSAPLIAWAKSPASFQLPQLEWLNRIPVIGDDLYFKWQSLMADGGNMLLNKIPPYIGKAATWFLTQAANAGRFLFHLALMVMFSVLLYWKGDQVMLSIRHFAIRLADQRGDAVVLLAARSIRAVALGVVVTALVQAIAGGIGLAIAGIPYAMILTVLMFVCCVAQLGPLLILVPSIAWLYWTGETTWGTILIIWSLILTTMDGVLRPFLIRLGADLPMVLILTGVIGGILSLGVIGLFIGPVVLAVSYSLLLAWMNEVPKPENKITDSESHFGEKQVK
ncbi:AI-2E family transporter YdiK [Xenorhabdus sp. DI]|uniref:AI-2E family transporter YdiK n=1 Tax=Xenorhabdus doucetiae TaxID=351671 RepID=UPI0019A0FB35|nr:MULTISPECIES: AI-2E family transporter YdiK [unclassified Xenorhabdus]MBD2785972.1 AI-2E family transporter YdiK [Xenorhabdus sp. 3]MBD2787276.1 AI-2E family transporter YdiK [Xenorhabdus sp. DI]